MRNNEQSRSSCTCCNEGKTTKQFQSVPQSNFFRLRTNNAKFESNFPRDQDRGTNQDRGATPLFPLQNQFPRNCYTYMKRRTRRLQDQFAWCTRQDVHEYTYFNYSSTTTQCAATTRHPAARALRQPCCALRVLVSRPQRLYIDYAVRRHDIVFWAYDYFDYSSRLVSTRKLVEDGSRDINN
jgi:hypothetical protein